MSKHYGATEKEWNAFDILMGLTEDLLPVVSNPDAAISPKSTLETTGKVPSKYTQGRKIVGIADWTKYHATTADITRWSKEEDYGICLQTRQVRGLDVDITDHDVVQRIVSLSADTLRVRIPIRRRNNSTKCLLGFRLTGQMPKRVLKTHAGIIEFLGNGQQFIAIGTHPSGVRYEWDAFTDFPEVSLDAFEALWKELVTEFGTEAATIKNARKTGEDILIDDPVLDQLAILNWGPQGQAHIECPFKADHTSESGESSTSYFPAGTKGYDQGHFICLHAHCAARKDEDFLDALNLRDDFDALPAEEIAGVEQLPMVWPKFKRKKGGEIYPTIDNLYRALRRDDVSSARIAYDNFKDEIVIASDKRDILSWRALGDNDYTLLQIHLERTVGFEPISIDLLRRAAYAVAYENAFDSAQLWLTGLKWDGVPRVDTFMARYMKADPDAYSRAVSLYLWTALAGRVMTPGIKADMMPIFVGAQGTYKSSTVESFAPKPEFFCKISFAENDDNLSRKMRGRLVAEVPELSALGTKKDMDAIKDFVSSSHETWVPKWKEHPTTFARRVVFIATTNNQELLADETGNRRWLPIAVGIADIETVRQDRDQLWAEAREMFLVKGVCFEEAEQISSSVHKDYMVVDPWQDVIAEWLESPIELDGSTSLAKGYITTEEVMTSALRIEARNMRGTDTKRIARVLRQIGFLRFSMRFGKRIQWVWKLHIEGEK